MKFQVDGVDKIVTAKFVYDNSQKRYVIDSDLIEEIKAVDETTKKDVYVYSLKSKGEESARYEIKRGYYGYSGETGCFYYGTLYVGDNGESIFVADKGIYAILNPPMCDYWIC